jgi:hypothetical protein
MNEQESTPGKVYSSSRYLKKWRGFWIFLSEVEKNEGQGSGAELGGLTV